MNAKPEIGDNARDFSLKDHNGKEFKLSDSRGMKVVLSFHPLAWTTVCAMQMKSLEDNKNNFDGLGARAVGLSVDAVPTKKAWAESLGIKETPLLADFWPHGGVAQLYGLFRDKEGTSQRANVILDRNQKVAFLKVYEPKQLPSIQEVIDALRGM
jgi:peroxiredoxin